MTENTDSQKKENNSEKGEGSVSDKPEKETGNHEGDKLDTSQWSWGAFMLDVPFLVAIQKYVYLLVYLLMLIPFVNFIIYIGFKIYLGLKGREMAQDSPAFDSKEEREGFFKGFDWAGKVLFFVTITFFVIGLLSSLVFGMSMMSAVGGDADFGGPGGNGQLEMQFEGEDGSAKVKVDSSETQQTEPSDQ